MDLKGKSAVITGGGSGIGLAITRALQSEGAKTLIVGRDKARLNAVRGGNTLISTFAADISKGSERDGLIQHLLKDSSPVDIFINNAGTMQSIDLHRDGALSLLDSELALNLYAPIHFATALLPYLLKRPEAAVVNITSGLIYAPFGSAPGYSAAKSGLHDFTRSLRWQTRSSQLQVLEVMPPTVDTELTKHAKVPKIPPEVVARAVVKALKQGTTELRVGQAKALYFMSRLAPQAIFNMMNKMADKSLKNQSAN